jgi:hypothetical protein
MKKAIIGVLCTLATFSLAARSDADCSVGAFYDQYPGDDAQYPLESYPLWPTSNWPNFGNPITNPYLDFELFANNIVIATSGNNPYYLQVTSGTLKSKWELFPTRKRGFITGVAPKYAFRTILTTAANHRFQSHYVSASFKAQTWYPPAPTGAKPGYVLFSHYNTEDDFYAAGLRKNGNIVLEKQTNTFAGGASRTPIACPYDQLGGTGGGSRLMLPDGSRLAAGLDIPAGWYTLTLDVDWDAVALTNHLKFYINGVDQWPGVDITDSTFEYGTGGVRTDYVEALIDDVKMR